LHDFNKIVEIVKHLSTENLETNNTTKSTVTTNHEIFALKLLMMLQMGLLINIKMEKIKYTVPKNPKAKYARLMAYYHQLSLIIPKNP
ncbi:hypothetical protein NE601_17270, partial [Erysipelatoclostridium ramosum]|nr:hypothetical protein [Thomasclavelia ramosa]